MKRVDVVVVLVGYNSIEHLRECLNALFATRWGAYRASVVYVDNASSDGSLEAAREFDPPIQIIANATNQGFSNACNQAVAASASRYVFLLNNDAFVHPEAIPLLIEFMDAHDRVGAAGARLTNQDGTEQWSARRFPTGINAIFGRRSVLSRFFPNARWVRDYLYKDNLELGHPFAVDWVPGSCTLVRREAYEKIGGLPADMHYWSDAVFCDRLRKAGWQVSMVPASRVVHHEGHGTGRKDRALRRWLIEDFHQGAFRFYCEHFNLAPGSFARGLARVGLSLRARVLMLLDQVTNIGAGASDGQAPSR